MQSHGWYVFTSRYYFEKTTKYHPKERLFCGNWRCTICDRGFTDNIMFADCNNVDCDPMVNLSAIEIRENVWIRVCLMTTKSLP